MTSEAPTLTARPTQNILAWSLIFLVAISCALVIGNPGGSGPAIPILIVVGSVSVLLISRTYPGYLVMATAGYFFAVIAATDDRYINAFDAILPFMLPAVFLGAVRRDADLEDRRVEIGAGHDAIRTATRGLAKAVMVFFGLAALSIVPMLFRLGAETALNSALALFRGLQGIVMFPLGLLWVRTQRRIELLVGAVLTGGVLFTVSSLGHRIFQQDKRAGIGWVLNHPDWPTEDPNSAGLAMVVLTAVILATYALRPRLSSYALIAVALTGLVLSQSRSGMLAMAVFLILNVRGARFSHLLLAVFLAALAGVLAPEDFRTRIVKSVMLERGSFELYSFLTRLYGGAAHLKAFFDNWLFGVGYLGATAVCAQYNELRISLPADNYYLETAVGMGVIGLAALGYCLVKLFRLGKVVLEHTAPGTLGHSMARLHRPLMIAVLVACLTGNVLVGVVVLCQLSVWCAMMVRAAHHSLRDAKSAEPPPG